jgi:hypothetical protein
MIAGRHRDRLLIAVVALAVALAVADSSVVVLARIVSAILSTRSRTIS